MSSVAAPSLGLRRSACARKGVKVTAPNLRPSLLGIAATTILGCQHPELQRPKHKEAFSCLTTVTGILAFILNLDNREQSTMGVISSSFCVLLGTGCGIYIAQNYVPPKIKKLIGTWMFVAKHIE
ncbi:hypothetical protein MUK42_05874 [Musa troglodytarum]|uniref:Uncharacterized protein n=1 Tax=Musa troglodytarum TaxID=320322 RepID=A0A9E7HZ43_9LILI|nr:hypothetical protein MUK42_05874 [Musa troglodytarum]